MLVVNSGIDGRRRLGDRTEPRPSSESRAASSIQLLERRSSCLDGRVATDPDRRSWQHQGRKYRPVGLTIDSTLATVHAVASETQVRLVSSAMGLMLRQGYSATGIDSICAEAGVSKGAFYHSFRSKEELAIAALESYYRGGLEVLQSIDVRDAAPADRLPLFVERLAERAEVLWENGCLIGGLAAEMALANDELQRQVAQQFDGLAAIVAQLAQPYAAALAAEDGTATSVAEDLLAFIEGAVVFARAHRDSGRLRPMLRRYATLLRAQVGPRSDSPQRSRRD